MGILSSLLGSDVIDKVSDVVDEFTTTDEERLAAELDQYKAETERLSVTQNTTLAEIDAQKARDLAQAEINKEEARSSNMWVARMEAGNRMDMCSSGSMVLRSRSCLKGRICDGYRNGFS